VLELQVRQVGMHVVRVPLSLKSPSLIMFVQVVEPKLSKKYPTAHVRHVFAVV
jgi:hypothetical protein